MPPGVLDWEYSHETGLLTYSIDCYEVPDQGVYTIIIKYESPSEPFSFEDDTWTWNLNNLFVPFPSTNAIPPSYGSFPKEIVL